MLISSISESSSSPPFLPFSLISSFLGVPSSVGSLLGVESMSSGAGVFGLLSSSASLISAKFSMAFPEKLASTVNETFTLLLAPTANVAIGVFNVATVPSKLQSASAKVKPAGTYSAIWIAEAATLP